MPGVLESSPASLDEMFLCFFPGREKNATISLALLCCCCVHTVYGIPIDHFKCFKSFDYLESSIIL